jgi:BirA family biotin operon repressor/biotin-[acetyl-CoA-carboxylase] ligase
VAGLGVCEALASLAPRAPLALKWPNDVFLGGRKVCGILAETVPGTADRVVVGIGINVNNSVAGQSGLELATALIDHDAIARDLTSVLTAVLDHFDRRWREFLAGGLAPLCGVYESYALLTGRFVEVELPGGGRCAGLCRGIDEHGQLCVQTDRELRRIVAGTIQSWQRDL